MCAYIFQKRWCVWLQATYHDPKDWLRGIINWNVFQRELFPFISLQRQKDIIGQGIHAISRESTDEWSWKGLTRGRMVQIQIFLQRNSNSSINPVLSLWSWVVLRPRVKHSLLGVKGLWRFSFQEGLSKNTVPMMMMMTNDDDDDDLNK